PLLHDRGIQGLFFPVAQPILEGKVLDVNKIHFVLSVVRNPDDLVQRIFHVIQANQKTADLLPPAEYWERYARPSRFDCAEVVFVKRMLQRYLPEDLRGTIAGEFFKQYVSVDEEDFARELYLTADQLRTMARGG